jgi:hypothetical protein
MRKEKVLIYILYLLDSKLCTKIWTESSSWEKEVARQCWHMDAEVCAHIHTTFQTPDVLGTGRISDDHWEDWGSCDSCPEEFMVFGRRGRNSDWWSERPRRNQAVEQGYELCDREGLKNVMKTSIAGTGIGSWCIVHHQSSWGGLKCQWLCWTFE